MTLFNRTFADPPREFSLVPFWFWNDTLDAAEIVRQIDGFAARGVYGFVIHPRVGLPRDLGWMTDRLLGFYRVAVDSAADRDMKVLLYDEGMYPSGSSSGQVVARHPELACRCLARHRGPLPAGATWVADGVVDRPADSYVRGLHYVGDGPAEDEPPAGDILNPRTAAAVIDLVYDRFHATLGDHFGRTILGVFTDEPNPLGKCREAADVFPYTPGLLDHVRRLVGRDINPATLWTDPQAAADYRRAVRLRLNQTWYAPLSDWCAAHGVALCGHPDAGDEIGVQRYFHVPGQDLVWRWVLPDHASATRGPESTQAKCSSSAMIHYGRRRNSNEFCGAYGHETTFDEVRWLANWCLVRGVNLLIPHAFYYSVRGCRRDERPPQLGPHTAAWEDGTFAAFAFHCRRASWLNTDSTHVCAIAVLTHDDRCPWPAAEALMTRQRDFNYLDPVALDRATVTGDHVRIGGMAYAVVIVDGDGAVPAELAPLTAAGRVIRFGTGDDLPSADTGDGLVALIDARVPPLYAVSPATPSLRLRTVVKDGRTVLMAFNEAGRAAIDVTVTCAAGRLGPVGGVGGAAVRMEIAPNELVFYEVI